MQIGGKQASPGLALAIVIPLIPGLAYLTSSQPPAPRCATASCRAAPSAHASSLSPAGGTASRHGTRPAQPGACSPPSAAGYGRRP